MYPCVSNFIFRKCSSYLIRKKAIYSTSSAPWQFPLSLFFMFPTQVHLESWSALSRNHTKVVWKTELSKVWRGGGEGGGGGGRRCANGVPEAWEVSLLRQLGLLFQQIITHSDTQWCLSVSTRSFLNSRFNLPLSHTLLVFLFSPSEKGAMCEGVLIRLSRVTSLKYYNRITIALRLKLGLDVRWRRAGECTWSPAHPIT